MRGNPQPLMKVVFSLTNFPVCFKLFSDFRQNNHCREVYPFEAPIKSNGPNERLSIYTVLVDNNNY